MAKDPGAIKPPYTIKKYANRRLYNTATSSYVTLDHLAQMVKDGTEFVVYDAKSGEEITRSVLTQIIVEEENKGQNLLPIGFLRHLISFYGDSLQGLVPRYLEHSMQAFARNQEQMRHYMQDSLNGLFPFGQFEEMGKQNMALFENAMRMFTPFIEDDDFVTDQKKTEDDDAPTSPSITDVQSQLREMQRQIDALTKVTTADGNESTDK
ncbi:polyhydroxyalkanoate synthesis repressor PhaR [Magnetospira thiophila]